MPTAPEHRLLGEIHGCSAFFLRARLVTSMELLNKVLDELAHVEKIYPELIPHLWVAMAQEIHGEFAEAIRQALQPGYHFREFRIGDSRSEAERRRSEELATIRLKQWAIEFAKSLDGQKLLETPETSKEGGQP